MFAEYHKERDDYETIKNEHGFIVYKFIDDYCFIRDIYVKKEVRFMGKGSELADLVVKECKKKDVKKLFANCIPSTKISTDSIKAILGYGFNLFSASNDCVTLIKELE